MNATHLSDPVLLSRLVVFSIIPFFLIVGLVGNIFVVYIYVRQSKKSNVETFILLLAVIDLIGCIFGMPLEMAELYPAIQSKYLCRLYKFVIFICSIMSSLILLIIAIERFRRICQPSSIQITPKLCISLMIFTIITALAFVLPPVLYTDSVPVSHEHMIYIICNSDFRRPFLWLYALIALIIHSIVVLSMTVLYSFVRKTIKKHFKKKETKEETSEHERINRTNIVLISISVLYFVSFSPTLLFCVSYPFCKDSNLLQILKVVLYRTWILNSSLNPMVYGFCNKIFRKSFVNIFTRDKTVFEMEEKF
ncbi:neuropeptide FF receptor 2-like [Octopus bimaculoides]|uniref:G-protein coupled receptors family 1 profile domain-containing protein n=1 Tax=Octopus bimaculoides TaxID=37653 RepID=A0A0L8HM91_OCTBM|nr:neuropeptide FF receptor 2-like [Octopus bimaculoides]